MSEFLADEKKECRTAEKIIRRKKRKIKKQDNEQREKTGEKEQRSINREVMKREIFSSFLFMIFFYLS